MLILLIKCTIFFSCLIVYYYLLGRGALSPDMFILFSDRYEIRQSVFFEFPLIYVNEEINSFMVVSHTQFVSIVLK